MGKRRGGLLAIEGIDQSGKRTQSRLLAEHLLAERRRVSVFNFPDYGTPVGRQLKAYLQGRLPLNYRAVHMLYAVNRWEKEQEIRKRISAGHIVIVNRYSPSNLAYGVSHGLPLRWLAGLEEGLPKTNLVLILDVQPKTSFSRKQTQRDLHENDVGYLLRVRRVYLKLAREYGWKIIGGSRMPQQVHKDVWRAVISLSARESVGVSE